MGLDLSFYKDGEELLYFRNHDEFMDLFTKQKVQEVSPEDMDFYVDMTVLNGVAADLQQEVQALGLTERDLPRKVPKRFWEIDARAASREALLRVYPLLVQSLRRTVYERGTIICSWSA